MVSLLEQFSSSLGRALLAAGVCFVLWAVGYVVHQVYFHPLARFPGPLVASVTDLWQVQQVLTLRQPYNLTALHAKYGQFVRYGPDKLSITAQDAVACIYQKGGSMMPKTEYYDAFGAAHPNVFGMRDEAKHSIRRRHMSHSFSISYVREMEKYLDENIVILRNKISEYSGRGESFDLKKLLQFYVVDVLGELAFSQSFGVQVAGDEYLVPPVIEHTLLATVTGSWPAMTSTLKRWLPKVPHKGLQALFRGRTACAALASRCVERRMAALQEAHPQAADMERKDILTKLILAKDPDTGENLTQIDLETEAFGFIIAGTHTTSATTTLLFWNLLHNPEALHRCVDEVATQLPALGPDRVAYSVTEVETSLPFLRKCVRENFRATPVFTMPLSRKVMAPGGVFISGQHIPQGASVAVCNHAFHHDPETWGADHGVFDPGRWGHAGNAERARYLMHFGLGGRQCVGKTVAQANIYKLASTLLREFDFCLADAGEQESALDGGYRGVMPPLISVGVSDLEGPLMVKARRRGLT